MKLFTPFTKIHTLSLFMLLAMVFGSKANGQGVLGAYMRYDHVQNAEYKITLYIERTCLDCKGKVCLEDSLEVVSTSKTQHFAWQQDTQFVSSPSCYHVCRTNNCDTTDCETITQLLEEQYSVVVDLSTFGCDVQFRSYAGDRFSDYINLSRPDDVWVFSSLNRCNGVVNSAPDVRPQFTHVLGYRESAKLDWTLADADSNTNSGDSFYFRFTDPMRLPGVKVLWEPPFTYTKPIKYRGFPQTYAPGLMPFGLQLDPHNGRLEFNADGMGNYVSAILIEEHRNGKLIGQTMVEKGFSVASFPSQQWFGKVSSPNIQAISRQDTISIPFTFWRKAGNDSITLQHNVKGDNAKFAFTKTQADTLSGFIKLQASNLSTNDVIHVKLWLEDPQCSQRILFEKEMAFVVRPKNKVTFEVVPYGCDSFQLKANTSGTLADSVEFSVDAYRTFPATHNRQLVFAEDSSEITFTLRSLGLAYYYPPERISFNLDSLEQFRNERLAFRVIRRCYSYDFSPIYPQDYEELDSLTYSIDSGGFTFLGNDSFTIRRNESGPFKIQINPLRAGACYDSVPLYIPNDTSDLEGATYQDSLKICAGDSVTIGPVLRNPGSEVIGIWDHVDDTTLQLSVSPKSTKEYTFTLFDTIGCQVKERIYINVIENINVNIADSLVRYCQGDGAALLQVEPSGGEWLGDAIIDSAGGYYFSPHLAGIGNTKAYYKVIESELGCVTGDSVSFTVNKLPDSIAFAALAKTGTQPFKVYFYDSSSTDVASWKWRFSTDPVKTSILKNPIITFEDTGKYAVTLTVSNQSGCSISYTKYNYVEVYALGKERPLSQKPLLAYNPKTQLVTALGDQPENLHYRLLSMGGKLLEEGSLTGNGIDLSTYPRGLYMVQCQSADGQPFIQQVPKY